MKIDWTSLPETEGMRKGATRKAVSADKLSAVLVETSPDADFDGKLHWHENEMTCISSLSSQFIQKNYLKANFATPSNEPHMWAQNGDWFVQISKFVFKTHE